jgi:hypothetical protein
MHNGCLIYLLSKYPKPTIKQLVNGSFDYIVQADGGFIKAFDAAFIEKNQLLTEQLYLAIKNEDAVTLNMLDLLELDKEIKAEATWLLHMILNFDGNSDSLIDALERVTTWEYRLLQSKLEFSKIAPLLMGSAIARHSLHFWTKEFDYQETSETLLRGKKKKKCLRAIFTVAADVIGGVAGGIAGATVGGPVGAGVGAVVVGGAMSGGANAIFR